MALMSVSAARLSQLHDQRAGPLVFSMEDEKRRAYNEFFAARILSILTLEQTDQKREDLLADLLSYGFRLIRYLRPPVEAGQGFDPVPLPFQPAALCGEGQL